MPDCLASPNRAARILVYCQERHQPKSDRREGERDMPKVGESAPDFELLSDEGKPVKLSDFRGKKVILYFYPADFTSGCELQACSFRDAYPEIEAKNAVVLGVSPDGVDSHKKFREALHLPFHLLADTDLAQLKAWNCYG